MFQTKKESFSFLSFLFRLCFGMASPRPRQILSIQSHVVHGYVGNRAAIFPLQLMGNEVDFINTVQFSNHTGYPGGWTGQTLGPDALLELFEGLKKNDLHLNYDYVLSGYIGSTDSIRALNKIVAELRQQNPNLLFFCDPVMGDDGKFYVPSDAVEVYRNEVLKCASIITPNYFEIELLSGIKIQSKEDVLKACDLIHEKGVGKIVMTGFPMGDNLLLVGSTKKGNDTYERFQIHFPAIKCKFVGAGDIFAALLLAWLSRGDELTTAAEKALAGTQVVLNRTAEKGGGELRVVESRKEIENPQVLHFAEKI